MEVDVAIGLSIILYVAVVMIVCGICAEFKNSLLEILSKSIFWPLWLAFYIVYVFFYTFKLMYEKLKN